MDDALDGVSVEAHQLLAGLLIQEKGADALGGHGLGTRLDDRGDELGGFGEVGSGGAGVRGVDRLGKAQRGCEQGDGKEMTTHGTLLSEFMEG